MPARSVIFRLLAAAPLCALCACATTAPADAELGALRAELRTLRASQERLKERVERLEAHDTVARAASKGDSASSRSVPVKVEAAPDALLSDTPDLAVVKLKPRREPAPKLPTAVAVMEPDDEQMEMFISPVAEDASSVSAGAATLVAAKDDSAGEEKDPDLLELEFDQGVSMLRTGNVEGGVERLARFAQENPRHPRADNALYFSGLGQIGLNDFKQAAKTFQRLIDSYPAGDAMLDGMLRLAECRMRLNQAADAKVLYTRVVTQFPGTAAATQAEQRLAALPQ